MVQSPGPHLGADLVQCRFADRGQERHEQLAVLGPRGAFPEPEPQEVELDVLMLASPVVVLAVHDPGLLRVQGQPDLAHPFPDRREHMPCLAFADAVHHHVVHVAFERDGRERPGHPRIERVVEEQVRQDR